MTEFVLNTEGVEEIFSALPDLTKGFVEAMFFTRHGEDFPEGLPVSSLAPSAVRRINEECDAFSADNAADVALLSATFGARAVGRDFWYTRNGHGVGFWARTAWDDEEQAALDRLDDECKGHYGQVDLYRGDDGRLYLS
jgi:hypothetical protein